MLAHRLRHRIHFQHKLPDTVNANGLRTAGGWATVVLDDGTSLDAVPAEVLTGPGREWIAAGATQSEVSARINCRWFPAISLRRLGCVPPYNRKARKRLKSL